jgi:putative hydrolase
MKYIMDLHCHSIASGHAYSTIQENAKIAAEKNLKFMGISDHAPGMPGGTHLYYFFNLKVLPKEIDGVRILKGVEANIVDYNGTLDIGKEVFENLDYAIASLHPPCINFGTVEENTRAIINAMKNPYVKIIGHPDDSRFPLNYEEIVKAAKEYGVLLEVNNSSLNAGSFRAGAWENVKIMLNLCKEYRVKVILGSDAHISYDVGNFTNCAKLLEEVDFPEELVVNYNEEDIMALLQKR